jgi:hypothetical protein
MNCYTLLFLDKCAKEHADKDPSAALRASNHSSLVQEYDTGQDQGPCKVNAKWREIYELDYKEFCRQLGDKKVTQQQFYITRRHYRPMYKLNHQYMRRGWDHLRCSDCDHYTRKIASRNLDPEQRKSYQDLYKSNLIRQGSFRLCYYATRAKQAEIQRNLSAITDGAGSTGLMHCPRPKRMSKNIHPRHDMCKIKSTFTNIHGKGITVDINFPNCEKMGTNLTIDIMVKTIRDYLEEINLQIFS